MNTTTNYNFNVPVGSDLVNPLVRDFPNWISLDSILKGISETGISTATHTKAGTVHAILLADSDIPFFRFQATAAFNTNDTFTVDGVAVSGITMDGAGLPNEAFVIGSMVLCELNNNVLTFYGVTDTDADTLEGHAASYFATASDLQTVDDKADANKLLIDDINTNLTDLEANDLVAYENISSHTSLADCYTAPCDGYLYIVSEANSNVITKVYGSTNNTNLFTFSSANDYNSVFIRKGMRIYKSGGTGTYSMLFMKLG